MKKTRVFFLCIISLFIVISCTKTGKNITLKGKVVNPITGEPISGQKIVFYKGEISLEWSSGWKIIKETYSDENGDFEISALRIGEILARKDGFPNDGTKYYDLGWDYNGSYHQALKLDKGRKMYADYHLVPYGKYRININNINCGGETDTLFFKKQWTLNEELYANWSTPRVGCYTYEGDIAELPLGEYIFTSKIIRAGQTTFRYDTLYVKSSGVSTVYINY